jgi:hypothetical protein
MVDEDWVAFPVCAVTSEEYWSSGRLAGRESYWRERNWLNWTVSGAINYFRVADFRAAPYTRVAVKGVTEGSETSVNWPGTFCSREATVTSVGPESIGLLWIPEGRRQTRRIPAGSRPFVAVGDQIKKGQVIAGTVPPIKASNLVCPGVLPPDHIARMLVSLQRTERYSGVKLARLRGDASHKEAVKRLVEDSREDVYTRLEGVSYLAGVGGESARDLFGTFLSDLEDQTKLEAVIALGETSSIEAVGILSEILERTTQPFFLRSAAAWCLGRQGTPTAAQVLIRAFTDVEFSIREEALDGIVAIGGTAAPMLLAGLAEADENIAAGCAEALRRHGVTEEHFATLIANVRSASPSSWAVWLLGFLPREKTEEILDELQSSKPELHYAASILLAFVESWIAARWELQGGTTTPRQT